MVEITPYRGNDVGPCVSLLAECLVADAVTMALFTRKVLLDPNFDPEGALVAKIEDRVVGFLLAIARRQPLEDGPDDRDRGYITLFAVAPECCRQGVGRALMEQALAYLRGRGCGSVLVSPYAPNYWTPGVDVAAYPEAVALLEDQGFRTLYRPISMNVSLVGGWRVPDWVRDRECELRSAGYSYRIFNPGQIPALTDFLRREFPGDWQRYVRETMTDITLGRRMADDLVIAWRESEVVGFAQHEGERFGPFGVAASQRGKGLGAVLLFRTLEAMRQKGFHNAWFLWTDDATAARVYNAAGFKETRRYAVMRRDLSQVP